MSNKATVLPNQSLADIAVRHKGGLEAMLGIAQDNNKCITDALVVNEELMLKGELNDIATVRYLTSNKIMPATSANIETDDSLKFGGINYMGIEIDFKVS